MKVEIRRDIDINNKEVANDCYDNFIERMLDAIADMLGFKYDVEYELATQAANDLSKKDFLEILNAFQDLVKEDKNWN